jgi:hypothetical protein
MRADSKGLKVLGVLRCVSSPYLAVLLGPTILFIPMLFMWQALYWGTPALQFIPWWAWSWETLFTGHLPLWNPLLGMGAPLIANYQVALFYPPYWIYLLLYAVGGVATMAWGQILVALFHLILAGFGIVALMRKLGYGNLAQAVSGIAFSLSGYLVARAWFASINAAVAWLPWVLFFTLDIARTKRFEKKKVIALGLIVGLQMLSGHAQSTWYTLLLAGLWASYWAWSVKAKDPLSQSGTTNVNLAQRYPGIARLLRTWAFMAASLVLGVLLSVVQLAPTAEYLLQSQRASAVGYEFAMTYSFWPWRILSLFAPDLFGNPSMGDYWGYANYWEDAVYVGLLPLLMAVGIVLRSIGKNQKTEIKGINHRGETPLQQRKLVWFLVVILFISLLLALGQNTPVYPWLYEHVPTFDMFQAPTRISIWMVFGLVILAGIGVEQWRRPEDRGLYWTRLGTAGAFAVTLGAGIAWLAMGDIRPTFIRATAIAGFWGLGSGILSLTAPEKEDEKKRQPLWEWAVVLWIVFDLVVAGWGLNPSVNLDFYQKTPETVEKVKDLLDDGRLYLVLEDETDIKYERFLRFDTFFPFEEDLGVGEGDWFSMRGVLLPNLNLLDDIPVVSNYDPFTPGRYARWMEVVDTVDFNTRERLWDLMAVSVVERSHPDDLYGVRFVDRGSAKRIRWVPCAQLVEDGEAAWRSVFEGAIDFDEIVIIEGHPSQPMVGCDANVGYLEWTANGPNQIQVEVGADKEGWLVLSDVWYPGWQAIVDGEMATIERANFLFRAVKVPPGSHKVVFVYRPICFYIGAVISILAWFILSVYAVLSFRRL